MILNKKTGGAWVGLTALSLWLTPLGQAEVHVTDNVVVVVDASGSMGSPMRGTNTDRMSVAKDALKQVLGQIPSSTHVGVLVFPNGNWVYPLGLRNDERLNGAIDSITSQGGTPLGEYMKQGADALLEARKKQFGYGTYRLLVVTDGEANDAVWLMATRRTSSPAASPSMPSGWRCNRSTRWPPWCIPTGARMIPNHFGRLSTKCSPRCPLRTPGQLGRMHSK